MEHFELNCEVCLKMRFFFCYSGIAAFLVDIVGVDSMWRVRRTLLTALICSRATNVRTSRRADELRNHQWFSMGSLRALVGFEPIKCHLGLLTFHIGDCFAGQM